MSNRFQVDPDAREPIYEFEPGTRGDEVPNVIYIRPRLNVGQTNLVLAIAAVRGADGNAIVDEQAAEFLTAQMLVSIVGWSGPDFDGIPCNPATIRNLPGNDPFVQQVRNEIALRNRAPESPDQKKAIVSGSNSSGLNASTAPPSDHARSGNGKAIFSSPSTTTGRPAK